MSAKPDALILKRKNVVLDQIKINRAKRIFDIDTKTEAVDLPLQQALDLSEFWRDLDRGFTRLIRQGWLQRSASRAKTLALTDVPPRFRRVPPNQSGFV